MVLRLRLRGPKDSDSTLTGSARLRPSRRARFLDADEMVLNDPS